MQRKIKRLKSSSTRRSFLRSGLAAPAAIGLMSSALSSSASADSGSLTFGDASILRFLSALEILETDLWTQYNELGGIQDNEVPGGTGNKPYTDALGKLDMDMSQYIHDNTEDEFTHFNFINEYLESKGATPVDLSRFRTLPGSTAPGSSGKKRLTNLMQLTVDTSWWTRYRSRTKNPDLGDTKFDPVVPGLLTGKFPAIPRNPADSDTTKGTDHIQAIAQTAAFHFGTIEQGGSSLYPSLAQRVSSVEVLRILLSIGPTETMHFQTWSDKAGNILPVTDPTNGLVFPDLSKFNGNQNLQANLIMPEPTHFLSSSLPVCSIIRPTETRGAAMGAFNALMADGLFIGQSPAFFATMQGLATQADLAERRV
jgi:Ferritin-like domain